MEPFYESRLHCLFVYFIHRDVSERSKHGTWKNGGWGASALVARMESILAPKKLANCVAVCNGPELSWSSPFNSLHSVFEPTHFSTVACQYGTIGGVQAVLMVRRYLRTQLAISRTTLTFGSCGKSSHIGVCGRLSWAAAVVVPGGSRARRRAVGTSGA